MNKEELTQKFIDLNEKTNVFLDRVSRVLEEVVRVSRENTMSVKEHGQTTKEMVRAFNRIWYIFVVAVLALVVLSGAEKLLEFLPKIN